MPPGRWVCCSLLWPLTWQVLRKEPPGEMTMTMMMTMMMTMLTGSWILTYCKVTRISSVSLLKPIDYVQRCFQLYVIALYYIFFSGNGSFQCWVVMSVVLISGQWMLSANLVGGTSAYLPVDQTVWKPPTTPTLQIISLLFVRGSACQQRVGRIGRRDE